MAKKPAKTVSLDGLILARVLVAFSLMELAFKTNDLVAADEATIKSLGDNVDTHADAVAYCKEQGIEPIVIAAPVVDNTPPADPPADPPANT